MSGFVQYFYIYLLFDKSLFIVYVLQVNLDRSVHLMAKIPQLNFISKLLFMSCLGTMETLKMKLFHNAVIASPIQAVPLKPATTGKSTKAQERVLFDRALITYNKQAFEEESRGSLLKKQCC